MNKIILKLSFLFLAILPVNADIKASPIIEGSVDAKIKIIVYESLTCSHCANFHKNIYPELKKTYLDTNLAMIEFKSFPLDMAALNASKIAHCRNDGSAEILHFIFKNQETWMQGETIDQLNLNLEKLINKANFGINFNKCINNKNLENHILEDRITGVKKHKVNATPTIIINEKKFDKSLTFKNLKKFIEKLI
tara:strand:+ start:1512 stop:2093 length:582 start_codon:yes stop_codon:yes gene_type:complete